MLIGISAHPTAAVEIATPLLRLAMTEMIDARPAGSETLLFLRLRAILSVI